MFGSSLVLPHMAQPKRLAQIPTQTHIISGIRAPCRRAKRKFTWHLTNTYMYCLSHVIQEPGASREATSNSVPMYVCTVGRAGHRGRSARQPHETQPPRSSEGTMTAARTTFSRNIIGSKSTLATDSSSPYSANRPSYRQQASIVLM